ncbi:GntR family transcriptional regulator [Amycolatopsis mongoliensis]|uniref:GntR family transcriptional regulator n=1 Tax=Amycolatopsis mongoliensis TaxID=715475 RepID=A0A9Y2JIZ6_9PSEU|nr:GntR family transcriptional regulator [Amycolatopsis sp. 4-36]WIX98166.1 GntR family transcriptional regulator [Amycolatopsis sp. 4-36]
MGAVDDVMSYLLELMSGQAPGTRVPSERELAQRLGIARTTVRTSVQHLVAAGLLTPRHGSGMFVAAPKAITYLDEPAGGPADDTGRRPFGYLVLDTREGTAGAELAGAIRVAAGEHTTEFRRLLVHDSAPVAIESAILAQSTIPDTTGAAFFDLLDRGRTISSSTISCELAAGEFSRVLRIPVAQPLLVVERVRRLPPAETPVYVRTCYRADRLMLRQRSATGR